jgi:hypothetical protein
MQQWRILLWVALLAVLAVAPPPAMAQSAPATACFEMFPAETNAPPGMPLLINKCTGETYLLARVPSKAKSSAGGYRWVPIGVSDGKDEKPVPAAGPPAGRKCFSFEGRHFCQ